MAGSAVTAAVMTADKRSRIQHVCPTWLRIIQGSASLERECRTLRRGAPGIRLDTLACGMQLACSVFSVAAATRVCGDTPCATDGEAVSSAMLTSSEEPAAACARLPKEKFTTRSHFHFVYYLKSNLESNFSQTLTELIQRESWFMPP